MFEAEGHRLRQRDLAQRVVLTRSGVSRLIDRIEAAGLVRREAVPGDRRGTFVVLTDKGREALCRTWPAYARAIQRHFARYLTDEEARLVAAALERVLAAARTPSPTLPPE